ncbi:hypothetical protein AC578_4951 [Pseudocercospora eumusae]|uniref:Uncharacterized protein n=1 Tax=Pseudocercospora eumusae TaxID=321146 RepID=A0A139HNW2_9PEZI|nr:hypothetical protein AC578_4951 [Pseudocercospora eumusae]
MQGRLPFLVRTNTPEDVMETILRYLYQLDVRLPFEGIEDAPNIAEQGRLALRLATEHNFTYALKGLVVCEKLSDRFQRAVLSCIFFTPSYSDLAFMVDIAYCLHLPQYPGLDINAKLRYIALINLVFELDHDVARELARRGQRILPFHQDLQQQAAECAVLCAHRRLQRGACGPEVDSRAMRSFLFFCADVVGYDVTGEEVEGIITFEMMRRAYEASDRR